MASHTANPRGNQQYTCQLGYKFIMAAQTRAQPSRRKHNGPYGSAGVIVRRTLMHVSVAFLTFLCVKQMKQPRLKGSIHLLESLTTTQQKAEAADSAMEITMQRLYTANGQTATQANLEQTLSDRHGTDTIPI